MFQEQHNEQNMRVELETKDEVQEMAKIKQKDTKLQASRRYNTKVQPRAFQPSDLVLRVQGEARKDPQAGKLGLNREGPFRAIASCSLSASAPDRASSIKW